ncbi:hypothetical protein [Aminobacter sp. BE322]|uniref:hypothetical protein n=1 Tax=unclassified Aminobacter TaxID=2644704 RepID=UPI003D207117
MVRSLGTSLSAALVACALASPAIAKPFTYTNARFGTSVTFPDDVFTGQAEPPENGDGMTFLAEDGASLAVYGSNNALEQSPKQLADFVSGGHDVTYRKVGSNWVVLSGRDGDEIFYHRLELGRRGVIHAFLLKYPASARKKYDALVSPLASSLEGP